MRLVALALALLAAVPVAGALPLAFPAPLPPLALPQQGPEVPTVFGPVAVVTALDRSVFSYEEGPHAAIIDVPAMAWNRVILVFDSTPLGDPWDRLFSVGIGGFEVLHGTSPRAPFVVKRDISEYAALLPAGGQAQVTAFFSTYVAAQSATVKLEFYDDPTGALFPAHDAALPAWHYAGQGGHGSRVSRSMDFGTQAPSAAVVDIYLTGHGAEEFWFGSGYITAPQSRPRYFHLLVDGTEVARVVAMPYTYAFLGFAGGNGQAGPQEILIHQAMWWTAQQGLDLAGVHLGVGETPPYRAALAADVLPLLQGARSVELVQENGAGFWISGVGFLLDY